jgi:hypothetical protein
MDHVADAADAPPLLKSVRPSYVRYLRAEIIPRFQSLSEREYLGGPVGILNTFARFSYVLDEENLYWCIEWAPGLLVIDLTPNAMRWVARRSPNPEFGGRLASKAEIESFDVWERAWEESHNEPPPQYGIIFDAWDDVMERTFTRWRSASELQVRAIRRVLDGVNELCAGLPRDSQSQLYREHIEACRRSIFWNMRWEDLD